MSTEGCFSVVWFTMFSVMMTVGAIMTTVEAVYKSEENPKYNGQVLTVGVILMIIPFLSFMLYLYRNPINKSVKKIDRGFYNLVEDTRDTRDSITRLKN